jgi:hypothetical protein
MAYSIPVRSQFLTRVPLSIMTFPTHVLNRYQWVNKPPYVDPNAYPGQSMRANTLANQGVRRVGRQIQAIKRPT